MMKIRVMIANMVAENDGYGVWVCDVVDALNAAGITTSLEEFKAWALKAHCQELVTLRRFDLVRPRLAAKMSASEIRGIAGSTFHTIE